MVLESLGMPMPESELRELCDCTVFGTPAIQLIQAARNLGFAGSRKYSLSLEELSELTEQGYFPIVYVVVTTTGFAPDVHSLIVVSVTDGQVRVLDPKRGFCEFSFEVFGNMWSPMKNLAVVIAYSSDSSSSV